MLSVLIPTYNYNAFSLVEELHRQLTLEAIIFEIICLDDGSNSVLNNENKKINNKIKVLTKILLFLITRL